MVTTGGCVDSVLSQVGSTMESMQRFMPNYLTINDLTYEECNQSNCYNYSPKGKGMLKNLRFRFV